jgi:hypothetical protein
MEFKYRRRFSTEWRGGFFTSYSAKLLGDEAGAFMYPGSTFARRVFYDTSELRPLWSLCLFSLLVLSMLYGGNFVVRQFLQGAGLATLFFVREIRIFLTFFFATWIMGQIEGRSIADYGLPWRSQTHAPEVLRLLDSAHLRDARNLGNSGFVVGEGRNSAPFGAGIF